MHKSFSIHFKLKGCVIQLMIIAKLPWETSARGSNFKIRSTNKDIQWANLSIYSLGQNMGITAYALCSRKRQASKEFTWIGSYYHDVLLLVFFKSQTSKFYVLSCDMISRWFVEKIRQSQFWWWRNLGVQTQFVKSLIYFTSKIINLINIFATP